MPTANFGLPQSSAAAQAMVDAAAPGTLFTLPSGVARFNVNLSRRPDLSFAGPRVGGAGNIPQSQRYGTWITPETPGRPIFTVSPSALSQVGSQFYNLYGYLPDTQTDLIYVRNCNNGVVHDCATMYGRYVVHADGGDDNAWWDCRNLRGYQCQAVARFNSNLGWTVSGLVAYEVRGGQAGVIFDGYAQLNTLTHVRVDGTLDLSAATGYAFVFQGGAHHNTITVGKCEATLGAVMYANTAAGPPTRGNSVDLMVFSARDAKTPQVDIRAGVELAYIGDGCTFVGGNPAPILNKGTGSQVPSVPRVS